MLLVGVAPFFFLCHHVSYVLCGPGRCGFLPGRESFRELSQQRAVLPLRIPCELFFLLFVPNVVVAEGLCFLNASEPLVMLLVEQLNAGTTEL